MRSSSERVKAAIERSTQIIEKAKQRKQMILIYLCAGCSIFCVALLAVLIPKVETITDEGTAGMYASIFAQSNAVGYFVMGMCTFFLGICLTLICIHIRNAERGETHDC